MPTTMTETDMAENEHAANLLHDIAERTAAKLARADTNAAMLEEARIMAELIKAECERCEKIQGVGKETYGFGLIKATARAVLDKETA